MNGRLHVGLIIQQDLAAGPLPMICAPSAPWLMVAYARENDIGVPMRRRPQGWAYAISQRICCEN